MKRFIISLTLIILSFISCYISSEAVERKASLLQDQLNDAAIIIETANKNTVLQKLGTVTETWNKTEKLLSFVVDADKIEQLSIDISLFSVHLKDDNKDYAMAKLRECERLLGEIIEDEKLNFKNIM